MTKAAPEPRPQQMKPKANPERITATSFIAPKEIEEDETDAGSDQQNRER